MMMNDISLVTDRLSQKYLLDNQSGRHEFKNQVVDRDLDKAAEYLKKHMRATGILCQETLPLIEIVVDKLKSESI